MKLRESEREYRYGSDYCVGSISGGLRKAFDNGEWQHSAEGYQMTVQVGETETGEVSYTYLTLGIISYVS